MPVNSVRCGCDIPTARTSRLLDRSYHRSGRMMKVGDVYCIKESIHSPIIDILIRDNAPNLPTEVVAELANFQRDVLDNAYIKNPRPCVIASSVTPAVLRHVDDSVVISQRDIYLTATFKNQPISNMPTIYQHFAVPIFPNPAITATAIPVPHLHPTPTWCKQNGYLIARKYRSARQIGKQWRERPKDRHPFHPFFDGDAMAYLTDLTGEIRQGWLERCADRSEACRFEDEFWVSRYNSLLNDVLQSSRLCCRNMLQVQIGNSMPYVCVCHNIPSALMFGLNRRRSTPLRIDRDCPEEVPIAGLTRRFSRFHVQPFQSIKLKNTRCGRSTNPQLAMSLARQSK